MARVVSFPLFVALACVSAAIALADPITCATCHADEGRVQPQTPMAHALELPPRQTALEAHPMLKFRKGAYGWTIERHGDSSTYAVSDGVDELKIPIRYSFGMHSATFVLEYRGALYESLVSYYAPIDSLDITLGDEGIAPGKLEEALGRRIDSAEAEACFNCHGSAPVTGGNLDLDALTPGVGCARCHAESDTHLRDIVRGITTSIPERLGAKSAEDMSEFCGACHRTWQTAIKLGVWGPRNVRFQPYRLANSKCFDGTDDRIRCTACHDPHRPLVRDSIAYDENCLTCHHAGGRQEASGKAREAPRSCPVAARDCVSCHMPKVTLPGSHQAFTDHQIRIIRPGEPYPD